MTQSALGMLLTGEFEQCMTYLLDLVEQTVRADQTRAMQCFVNQREFLSCVRMRRVQWQSNGARPRTAVLPSISRSRMIIGETKDASQSVALDILSLIP